jgi:ankyrin repeat protein
LGKGANVDALDNGNLTPLHLEVQNDHLEIINVLLDKGANINAQTTKGNTALHLAAENNHLGVEVLITKSANIGNENEEGKTALILPTERDNLEVKDYIRHQTVFNRRPETSGISGQLYEINLLMLFLLQGSKGRISFYLVTNVKEAGDLTMWSLSIKMKQENKKLFFLPTKHRENTEKDKVTI